jgi:hypothetical protein
MIKPHNVDSKLRLCANSRSTDFSSTALYADIVKASKDDTYVHAMDCHIKLGTTPSKSEGAMYQMSPSKAAIEGGIFRYRDRLFILDFDEFRTRVLDVCHSYGITSHPGREHTYEIPSRYYY